MPIDFLTAAERERLNRFPEPIPDDDLRVFFMLSQADQLEVGKQRGAHNQLGFALQLDFGHFARNRIPGKMAAR